MARGALAALAVLAFAGFSAGATLATPGGIGPPAPQTDSGKTISEIYWVVFTICAVVFVLVEAALILFIVRFRRRPDVPEHAEGPQIHGNTRLEIIWTLIPALALAAIAVYVFARTPAVEASPNGGREVRIRVEAHQFYWQYEYENGAISIDTLRLPVDTPVVLEITALDVDHSWWVPSLTGKKDALPGIVNELSFTPQKEGTYEGWCAEHCGVQHTVMYTRVEVVGAAEFERWVAEKVVTEASEELGRETWEGACAKCHGLEGEGDVGPPIAGNGTLLNRRALRQLVVYDGQDTPNIDGYMPAVGRGWITVQLDSLMAYIRSNQTLREGPANGGP
jgi:cytochrome c oxidase subunit II